MFQTVSSQFQLSKTYQHYFNTWLSTFIAAIGANMLTHSALIDRLYKIEADKILRRATDPAIPALELNLANLAVLSAVMTFFIWHLTSAKRPRMVAALYGLVFGLAVGVNHAVLNFVAIRAWEVSLVIIDISWTTLQCGIMGYVIGFMKERYTKKKFLGII